MRKYEDLSPYEFQALVADVLEAEDGRRYERFRGPDGGIDLRFSRIDQRHIVQCKNYRGSTWGQLISSLRKEVSRVETLAPTTYRVVTSLALTPERKDQVRQLFRAWMPDPSYVMGVDDLEGLLDRHPEVEKRHVKLWLSSVAVLRALLNNATGQQSRALAAEIEVVRPTYVQNRSFTRAWAKLGAHSVCVISGPAGMGKTTLAKMLIARATTERYEAVVVSEDIEEAWAVFSPSERQAFYYDDFLGRTNVVEKLGKNEDRRLTSFIEAVIRSKNKLLILTTREYIFEQARQGYEALRRIELERLGYVLRLSEYSRVERARILFNHLYHADLPEDLRRDATAASTIFRIVDHVDYTPRVVEYIASSVRQKPEGVHFEAHALGVLNDPELIWREAFSVHMEDAHRALLIVLASMPEPIKVEDLQSAYQSFCLIRFGTVPMKSFTDLLRVVEPTFVRIEASGDARVIRFDKPAALDFIQRHLEENAHEIDVLVESAQFFEQCERLAGYGRGAARGNVAVERPRMSAIASATNPKFIAALQRTYSRAPARLHVFREASSGRTHWNTWARPAARLMFLLDAVEADSTQQGWFAERVDEEAQVWRAGRGELGVAVALLKELHERRLCLHRISDWLHKVKEGLVAASDHIYTYSIIADYAAVWPTAFETAEWSELRRRFKELLLQTLEDGEDDDLDSLDEFRSTASRFNLQLDAAFAAAERRRESKEREPWDDDEEDEDDSGLADTRMEREEIVAMFAELIAEP